MKLGVIYFVKRTNIYIYWYIHKLFAYSLLNNCMNLNSFYPVLQLFYNLQL